MRIRLSLVALTVVAAALIGCKSAPAKPAGFVDSSRLQKLDDLPFHLAWRNPEGDFAPYNKIYIAPVDTSHLLQMDWWQGGEAGAASDFEKDVVEIAEGIRKHLKKVFNEAPEGVENRYTVVEEPKGADTLVLEFAIVQIIPSKASLEAAGWVMPFGSGILLGQFNKSTAAMEGRFLDANSKKILLAFADREGEQMRPVDLAGFTWYSHAKGIMEDWAVQLIKVANQKPGQVIEDTKTYTIAPW
ncbi:MAG: DUF3313 family protein [Planctomycetota bacterium]|jgi:hypothetical protein